MITIATICARGGSVGLPGKNIRLLQGKPLIAHTIEQALDCDQIDHVFVSTDCPDIASVAEKYGALVPFLRPARLATSTSGKHPVVMHLAQWVRDNYCAFDRIIDLDPTSPLRSIDDINACLRLLDSATDTVITAYEAEKNPYFNMVETSHDGTVQLSKRSHQQILSRQESPRVYAMNASIYCWHSHTLKCGLWGGRTKMHIMPRIRSIDIDELLDFALVDLILRERAQG